jgi:hypothetical protein
MSNQVKIRRITENATGAQGVIVSDNYGADYNFLDVSKDAVEAIKQVFGMSSGTGSDYLNDLFEHIEENKFGISVDDEYVEFEKFEHLFK